MVRLYETVTDCAKGIRFEQGHRNAEGVEGWHPLRRKFWNISLEMLHFAAFLPALTFFYILTVKRNTVWVTFTIAMLFTYIDFITEPCFYPFSNQGKMLYSEVDMLAFAIASVAVAVCLLTKARMAQPGILNEDKTPKSSRWNVGRGLSLPKWVGCREGVMPLPRKCLEFHSGGCYILEQFTRL